MIPVFNPTINKEDIGAVAEALEANEISGSFGKGIREFEAYLNKYHNTKYASLVNSGTSALHLAVGSLDLKRGDEVMISTFTNVATCLAVTHNGATPVAVDSEIDTWNMDIKKVEEKITKKTKAIITVDIFGHPVDMDPLLKIAKKYNLIVIEDAAESQGAEYKGRKAGCLADIGCLSFYANKTITTGEGGAVITNNLEIIEKVNLLKNLAFEIPRYLHRFAGYNYRMPNYVAALGASQMKRIEDIVKMKRKIASLYSKYLKDIPGVQLPVERSWAKNTYWMYGVVINPKQFGRSRDEIVHKLYEMGIETRNFFVPMNVQPVFIKMGFFKKNPCPVAEELGKNGFYLPSGYNLTEKNIEIISSKLASLRKN